VARADEKPVWTDRGESWPSIGRAVRAVGVSRSALSQAVRKGWSCAGRQWFTSPPQRAVAAAVEAERRRAASVRCNPGRNGYVLNGVDTRTGRVYVGGREVTEREGAAA